MMFPKRLLDPQRINLYAYGRNNPLRFIDPTGMKIDDTECEKHRQCREWKEEYLKSEEGYKQWNKLQQDQTLTVTIVWDEEADSSAVPNKDLNYNSDGELVNAIVRLAERSGDVNETDIVSPFNPKGATITDNDERRVYTIGHEFAHIEDAAYDNPEKFQRLSNYAKIIHNAVQELGAYGAMQKQEIRSMQAIIEAQQPVIEMKADDRGFNIVKSYRQSGNR